MDGTVNGGRGSLQAGHSLIKRGPGESSRKALDELEERASQPGGARFRAVISCVQHRATGLQTAASNEKMMMACPSGHRRQADRGYANVLRHMATCTLLPSWRPALVSVVLACRRCNVWSPLVRLFVPAHSCPSCFVVLFFFFNAEGYLKKKRPPGLPSPSLSSHQAMEGAIDKRGCGGLTIGNRSSGEGFRCECVSI